jgi:hypothetical protein
VHQTNSIPGLPAPVIFDTLNQRTGAVAQTRYRYPDFIHFSYLQPIYIIKRFKRIPELNGKKLRETITNNPVYVNKRMSTVYFGHDFLR